MNKWLEGGSKLCRASFEVRITHLMYFDKLVEFLSFSITRVEVNKKQIAGLKKGTI